MKQSQIVLGVTVLTMGILSAIAGVRATEPSEVDTNGNVMGAAPGEGAALTLSLKTTENFTLGAVTESTKTHRGKSHWKWFGGH